MPASPERLLQQGEMFPRVLSIENVPMSPNEHGLFTIDQVKALTSKRDCVLVGIGDYSCEIQYRRNPIVKIMAHDAGLWNPINIFRACREAAGQPSYEIDYAKARIKNPGGLDEIKIASLIAADGVRPYLSRPGQYYFQAGEGQHGSYHNPLAGQALRLVMDGFAVVHIDHGLSKAETGAWTWPLFAVMCGASGPLSGAGKSYEYRRAVRALDDAGLLKLTVGPRGGFGTATFEWLPLAYLQPIERPAPELDPVDAEALAKLA